MRGVRCPGNQGKMELQASFSLVYTHNKHMGPHTLPAHVYTHADMCTCARAHPFIEPSPLGSCSHIQIRVGGGCEALFLCDYSLRVDPHLISQLFLPLWLWQLGA